MWMGEHRAGVADFLGSQDATSRAEDEMAKNVNGARSRRTYREIFLDALREASSKNRPLVSNGSLLAKLGWDEERYQEVKAQLISEERLTIGKGQGGSVGLIAARKRVRNPSRGSRGRAKTQATRRGRRTDRDIFLAALTELSSAGNSLVSNRILRDELNWEDDRYSRVKQQLAEEGLLIVGRGQGGKVGLASSPGTRGLTLFISYSHVDEDLKNELVKHLEPLRRRKEIDAWHDRKIKPGEDWAHEISDNLEKADIVLLLISIDFINSKYCYEMELQTAMERNSKGDAVVVPIILRNCLWHNTPFAKLQALPKDGRAVTSFEDRDDALTTVAEGIRQIVDARLTSR